jgi:hypothetical protein
MVMRKVSDELSWRVKPAMTVAKQLQ